MHTQEIEQAIAAVERANKYAFTFAHPAYRDAEARLRALSAASVTIVLRETGGLEPVIGRGLKVTDRGKVVEN